MVKKKPSFPRYFVCQMWDFIKEVLLASLPISSLIILTMLTPDIGPNTALFIWIVCLLAWITWISYQTYTWKTLALSDAVKNSTGGV